MNKETEERLAKAMRLAVPGAVDELTSRVFARVAVAEMQEILKDQMRVVPSRTADGG